MPRLRPRNPLASDDGAIDLSSVIVAAVLTVFVGLGVVAVLFGLIPFVQDNGAKQDLAAVRTAESTAIAKEGRYYDHEGLQAAGLVNDLGRMVVGTNPEHSCYVAMVKSSSGNFFYSTDTSGDALPLDTGTSTGCVDFDGQIALSEKIGAPSPSYGELKNGSFEQDFTDWRTGPAESSQPLISTTKADVTDGAKAANLLPMTYIEQDVQVPSGGAAILSLSARVGTSFTGISAPLKLEVFDRSKVLAGTPEASAQAGGNYTRIVYDLSEYAGKNVTIRFSAAATAGVKWTSVDKISLEASAPSAPANVVGYTRDKAAVVLWDTPATGKASVTSYVVTAYLAGKAVKDVTVTGAPPAATAVIEGLDNGTYYTFGVKAVNKVGGSPESAKSQYYLVQPSAVANGSFEAGFAGWRTGGAAEVDSTRASEGQRSARLMTGAYVEQDVRIPGNGQVALEATVRAWGIYSSMEASIKVQLYGQDGVLLDTIAASGYGGGPTFMPVKADLSAHRGKAVTMRIATGVMKDSTGLSLDNVRLTESAPAAPSAPKGYGTSQTAHLTWNAVNTASSYVVTTYKAGTATGVTPTTAPSATITGLTNGTSYTFKVIAVNDVGPSALSAASAAIVVADSVVTNGSFEGGLVGWTVNGAGIYTGSTTGDGAYAASLPKGSNISQRVKLPSGTVSMDFKTYMDSGDRTARGALVVDVKDLDGKVLTTKSIATLYYFAPSTIDLSAYAGRDVVLSFTGNHDRVSQVDSVVITAK